MTTAVEVTERINDIIVNGGYPIEQVADFFVDDDDVIKYHPELYQLFCKLNKNVEEIKKYLNVE